MEMKYYNAHCFISKDRLEWHQVAGYLGELIGLSLTDKTTAHKEFRSINC